MRVILPRSLENIYLNYFPDKDLCDTCSYEEECDYVNATCIEGQCLCTTSQYVSRCGICEMRNAYSLHFF